MDFLNKIRRQKSKPTKKPFIKRLAEHMDAADTTTEQASDSAAAQASKPTKPISDSQWHQAAQIKRSTTLYNALGVSHGATTAEIKKAFFKLSKKWHPDQAPAELKDEYRTKFQDLKKAYKILTKSGQRDKYDSTLNSTFDQLKSAGKEGRVEGYKKAASDKTANKFLHKTGKHVGKINLTKFNKGFDKKLDAKNADIRRKFEQQHAQTKRVTKEQVLKEADQRDQLTIPKIAGKLTPEEFNQMFVHFNPKDENTIAPLPTAANQVVGGVTTESNVKFGHGIDLSTDGTYQQSFGGAKNPTHVDVMMFRNEKSTRDTADAQLNRKIKQSFKHQSKQRKQQLDEVQREGYIVEASATTKMLEELGLTSTVHQMGLNPTDESTTNKHKFTKPTKRKLKSQTSKNSQKR